MTKNLEARSAPTPFLKLSPYEMPRFKSVKPGSFSDAAIALGEAVGDDGINPGNIDFVETRLNEMLRSRITLPARGYLMLMRSSVRAKQSLIAEGEAQDK